MSTTSYQRNQVFQADLADVRMQNIVLLAHINQYHLLPGVSTNHYTQALEDLLAGSLLTINKQLFENIQRESEP